MTDTQKAEKQAAKLDATAVATLRKVVGAAPTVFHNLVSAEALRWLYQHAAGMTAEVVGAGLSFKPADLPEVAISVETLDRRQYGHYKVGRDGLGLRWRVALNLLHMNRPRTEILRTLCHEILHAAHDQYGKAKGKNPHGKEFREWSDLCGIPCNDKGQNLGIDPAGLFAAYCKRHKVEGDLAPLVEQKKVPKAAGSKLKKWTCDCGVNLRAAVEIDVTCNECGSKFVKQD